MRGHEVIQRYAKVHGRGHVNPTASIGHHGRQQRMPLPNFDLYTPLDSNEWEVGQGSSVSWLSSTASPQIDGDKSYFGHTMYEMI